MERIGKYHIQKVLGRGGMGTVYEAIDPLINRKVALKTMNAGMAEDADLRKRFLREAQAGGSLRHRNIVTVYDLGEDKGRPFIAMEFIEGTDLEKIIQHREDHTIEWKLDVLSQICEGLGYAHRNGIVHRDVKPANIRVTAEGEVKIMDFGIAHLQSSSMTKSGLVMGTVHYMAPEQVEGHKVDHRADIFAVGAIAYELIAYQRPFEGESITSVMFKIINARPDMGALPPTAYSPRLESVVEKALARALDQRYQSLDEMNAELQDMVRGGAMSRTAVDMRTPAPKRSVEDQAAQARREREMSEMRAEIEQARAEGQLQKALGMCKRHVEQHPEDAEGQRLLAEIESSIQDKEVEQLCGMALSYAADGDIELALKIAGRIERLAPHSPRFLELRTYLEEEIGRKSAEALTSSAQEHLAIGNLEEAVAAAEEALTAHPAHTVAREIRDRARAILDQREKTETDNRARAEEAERERVAREQAEREAVLREQAAREQAERDRVAQELQSREAEARDKATREQAERDRVTHEQAARVQAIREKAAQEKAAQERAAQERAAQEQAARDKAEQERLAQERAADELAERERVERERVEREQAAAAQAARENEERERVAQEQAPPPPAAEVPPAPVAAPAEPAPVAAAPAEPPAAAAPQTDEARRSEAAAATQRALDHFTRGDYVKARKAADKALALEPANKRARELMKILGSLG